MKLHLPLGLLCLLMTSLSLKAEAAEQTIDSTTLLPSGAERWEFTEAKELTLLEDVAYEELTRGNASSSYSAKGSLFSSTATMLFAGKDNNDGTLYSLKFSKITMTDTNGYTAGLLYSSRGDIGFDNLGSLTFADNSLNYTGSGSSAYWGSLISAVGSTYYSSEISFTNTGDITFDNNSVTSSRTSTSVGLIYSAYGNITFENTGNIQFTRNISANQGNLISTGKGKSLSFTNTGDITFENNSSDSLLYLEDGSLTFANTGDISLSYNENVGAYTSYGASYKGVISLFSPAGKAMGLSIVQAGDVSFIENKSNGHAGAISAYHDAWMSSTVMPAILLSADRGNIIFKGNMIKVKSAPVLNSIFIGDDNTNFDDSKYGVLTFRAQEGNEISFYDPIVSVPYASKAKPTTIDINANLDPDAHSSSYYDGETPSFTGTVRFSGKYVDEYIYRDQLDYETKESFQARYEASFYHNIKANTTVHDGAMVIEYGAVFGTKDPLSQYLAGTYTSFEINKGTLEMTHSGQLNAVYVTIGGEAVLRIDKSSSINAVEVKIEDGFSYDLGYFLDSGTDSGLVLNANRLDLGGTLSLLDIKGNTTARNGWNDFYSDSSWSQNQSFLILDTTGVAVTSGDISSIESAASGGTVISSPYTYQGTWSYEWVDSDGDGLDDQLYALWTSAYEENSGIIETAPELAGALVMNSLWSSASNVQSLASAARNQAGMERLLVNKDSHYWASGLGDFSRLDSKGTLDGYEYNGGGYSVGTDTLINRQFVLGIAFGQVFGTGKSRNHSAEIDQDTLAGSIYGSWYKPLNEKKDLLRIGFSASCGLSSNEMDTWFFDGDKTKGKWDNNTFNVVFRASWDRMLDDNWIITPFAGLEYTTSETDSFTETNVLGSKARYFDSGRLQNLSLPVGIGASKLIEYANGVKWTNSLSVAYVPDLYRDNGEAAATRLSNNQAWTARGSSPARNSADIEFNTRVQWNETWATFAGYGLETGSGFLNQRATLGVSASF